MKLAKIHVSGVRIRATLLSLVTKGLVGATVELEIAGPEWEGLARTVVFRGSVTRDVLDAEAIVTVPAEVVANAGGHLQVGIYGTDAENNIVIPTLWCDLGRIMDSADPSGDLSTDPELPVWAQLQQHIGDLRKLSTDSKDNLVAAINEIHASDAPEDAPGGGGSVEGAVLYTEQHLTEEQKAQARANIGAASVGNSVELDTTLTQSGKAADAKAVGDAITQLSGGNADYELPIGGDELGGVRNGGNVVINADGTMTAPDAIAVDTTLTQSGQAADAGVVGQRITEIDNAIFDTALGKNLVNPATVTTGVITNTGSISTYNTNVNYDTSDYIPVAPNTDYTLVTVLLGNGNVMTTKKAALLYDSSKAVLPGGFSEISGQKTLIFNTGDATYVRVSGQVRNGAENVCALQLEKGNAYTEYEPFGTLNKVLKIVSPGILYGKKYVACGDSFTAGDFTGYVDENGLSGKESPVLYDSEWKMYKTYPWWIAKRNNMTLVNDSQGGTTMALTKEYLDDPENVDIATRNPFAYQRYKRIPSDADYITIWFGLNDANGNTNLGTIDDADNTTFYGAWNVVLEYLLVNHPYAKVGIVVTDGRVDSEYQDAVREVAKKWGFPYLDLVGDPQIPAMIAGRDSNLGLCDRAKELRNAAFMTAPDNFHPGIKAHEYRSTIIENWLRML